MENLMTVLEHFGLGTDFVKAEKINSGQINLTMKIIYSDDEKYILQEINGSVFESPERVMHNIEKLSSVIPDMKIKFLCADNKNYVRVDNNYWRIYKYIENSISFEKFESNDMIYEFGKITGKFHRDTAGADISLFHETIRDFHNIGKRIEKLFRLHDMLKSDDTDFFEMILSFYSRLESRNLKKIIVHNDIKCSNALFDKSSLKSITLIDFDTVMPGLSIFDFGDGVRSSCTTENAIDIKKYRYYCRGYFENMRCEDKENYFLGIVCIAGELACRYLYDVLSGENYFSAKTDEQKLARYCSLRKFVVSVVENRKAIDNITAEYEKAAFL